MSVAPVEIDRLAPTHRPPGRAIGYHRWTNLCFLHWRLPAEKIAALLPPALTLDTWEGDAWVGLVPFGMSGVRPWWSPWGFAFAETNVRTYVHCQGRDPGVWFFSLEAANSLAVRIARRFWGLNYFRAAMSLRRERDRVEYRSRRLWPGAAQAGLALAAEIGPPLENSTSGRAVPGTLEHFLFERYLLYAQRRGRLLRGQVHHAPYALRSAQATSLQESLLAANGIEADGGPCHVAFSERVDVEIFSLASLPRRGAAGRRSPLGLCF
ncbi:MAG TPA: DUF2071 domain-containing protein [Pirellulales bacterium]|nr:DUF2071 domain-containing protein [Pirellulales bacterium]